MLIEKVVAPPLDNNAYLVVDEKSHQAAIVDPALAGEELLGLAEKHGAKVLFILNTHGHPDPTADDDSIRKATGAKIAIFEIDAPRLEKNARETRWYLPAPPPPVKPDLLLKEGSEIRVGDLVFRTMHTPGHTEGSACFHIPTEDALFTGDTLYAGSHGRTDTFGGSPAKMVFSLRRIRELPDRTHVYPGHGPETTLEKESWLLDLMYPML